MEILGQNPEDYSRKAELPTEFGAFRQDWLKSHGIELANKNMDELRAIVHRFYAENQDIFNETLEAKDISMDEEVSSLAKKHLNVEDFTAIRKKLGIEKWVPLSETVAFIKTLIDTGDPDAKNRYLDYCTTTFSLDEMRKVLAFDNDVKPVRLDTDIYHQTPDRSRSAVEIASNAIDAVSRKGITIGRFGVGFYQILAHLKSAEDVVSVETGNQEDGFYRVSFALSGKEIVVNLQENENQKTDGTTVTLISKSFPKEEAENLIKKHFAYNDVAKVYCNGQLVNDLSSFNIDQQTLPEVQIAINDNGYRVADTGIGMGPQVILEKLLVPKLSGKKPVQEIMATESVDPSYFIERKLPEEYDKPGKAVINIGGVMVEEFEIQGINTAKTLVIDLPPFTILGEERNQVAIDKITIEATKKLIDQVLGSGDIESINSLAPIITAFQQRSLCPEEENNLDTYFRSQAGGILPKDKFYLPNEHGFQRLNLENILLLDPAVKQSNWGTIPGMARPKTGGDGLAVYVAPMESDINYPAVFWRNRLILDQTVFEKFQNDPTLINLYLEALGNSTGKKTRNLEETEEPKKIENQNLDALDDLKDPENRGLGKSAPTESQKETEKTEAKNFKEYVAANWHSFGFPNKDSALSFTEEMNDGRREGMSKFYNEVMQYFPVELNQYLFEHAYSHLYQRNNTPSSYENLKSLALSPELLQTLADLNIRLKQTGEPRRAEPLGYLKAYRYYQKPLADNFYQVKYGDGDILVAEDGQVFDGQPFEQNRLGYHCICLRESNKLKFIDPVTHEYLPMEIPAEAKVKVENFQESPDKPQKTIIATYTDKIGDSLAFSRQEMANLQLYDADTGAIYHPDLEGQAIHIDDDGILFRVSKDEQVTYFLVNYNGRISYPDEGSRKEPDEVQEWGDLKYQKTLTGNHLEFLVAGKVVFSRELPPDVKNNSSNLNYLIDTWRVREYDSGVYSLGTYLNKEGNHSILMRSFEKTRDDHLNFQLGKESHSYTIDRGRQTTILFDEDGNKCFELEPNQAIIKESGQNKNTFFLVATYDNDVPSRFYDWSQIKDLYWIGTDGQRLETQDLKTLDKVNVYAPNSSSYDRKQQCAFPVYQGDSWKVDIITEPNPAKDGGDKYAMKIADKESGQVIIDGSFSDIEYIAQTDLWKCTTNDSFKKMINGKAYDLNHATYIDNLGNIVDQREIGQRTVNQFGERYTNFGIMEAKTALTPEKVSAMHETIINSDIQDNQRIEQFLQRSFNLGDLGNKEYSIIAPILIRSGFIDRRLLTNDRILYLDGRLHEYDLPNKAWFYSFLSELMPSTLSPEEQDSFTEKFIKVFEDKITVMADDDKRKMQNDFGKVKDYENNKYLVNGWNIVRYKTPVGSEQIPESIRPIVDYLRSDERLALGEEKHPTEFTSEPQFTLSQLIQTKRLNERMMQNFAGSSAELQGIVKEKTEGKSQEHIQREIIHPIYYQSVNNPYLFVRELVQNAHDAAIKSGSEEEKKVDIDIFSRQEKDMTFRIHDRVGMSLQEVLNYFLIPGETTKAGEQKTIGFFGQGLFTLFRGAKEVTIQTGQGDGTVSKLKITPVIDQYGMTSDLNLQLEQEQGDFKGTIIEKTVEANFPSVEAAYMKNAVCTFTSLVDGNTVNINLNGTEINRPQTVLSSVEVPGVGQMTLYDAPNNVITQRGLFVKGLDKDYNSNIYDVEKLLEDRGYVLDIPSSIDLTRSRNEIARKQEVLPALQERLPLLKLQAYLEIFRQDIQNGHVIQLDNLPYDYFYSSYSEGGKIAADAEKLKNGEPVTDVGDYIERGNLIKLLVLLPAVTIGDRSWSLTELKEASLDNKPPLDREENYRFLPTIIREKLLEGKEKVVKHFDTMERAKKEGRIVNDFAFRDWQKQPKFVADLIKNNEPAYSRMANLSGALNNLLNEMTGGKQVATGFYYEPGSWSSAHAGQGFNRIGWNLEHWNGWPVRPFDATDSPDQSLSEFLETHSHEFAHVIERTGDLTHNQSFYAKQAQVLANVIYKMTQNPELKQVADLLPDEQS